MFLQKEKRDVPLVTKIDLAQDSICCHLLLR